MEINEKTKIDDLLTAYPFLLDYFLGKSPEFKHLKNPLMRKTMGKIATLHRVAAVGKLDLKELIAEINREIADKAGERAGTREAVEGVRADRPIESAERREVLKGIIRDLHEGKDFHAVKAKFIELIKDVDATEIAAMEQELVREGMPETEVKRLCDVHVAVFEESLDRQETVTAPEGHPVHTFELENRAAEEIIAQMDPLLDRIGDPPDRQTFGETRDNLGELLDRLSQVDVHYARKENQLFPLLESHGITAPPQVMWAVHDDIRVALKTARQTLAQDDPTSSVEAVREVVNSIRGMVYKEENILFPMCLDVFSDSDWAKVAQGEEEIGYAWIKPEKRWSPQAVEQPEAPAAEPVKWALDQLGLDTGMLSLEQINLMLGHLPVDITFVDENDRVAYFSKGPERIFPRSAGIIGRAVQNCHPPKSVHIVNKILDEFKAGTRDDAEFWIQMQGRFIYIRYFAVRSSDGTYKGTLEVSQDVTAIRGLEGEQRLLDWD